ncbi:serine/threonine-protein kinase [Thermomonospora cellulosilytica]|uniref:Putative Ser/Thr protein kinase n=1 Tax=Thermomonospora cellulosilytica TaxID=1411118 RepID=A0A7W3N4F8_9ACTN|nr:serine/threonine-protein kinase [Thermomonospora cellulosilytica]MBA9007374.1 putative Ser/Thr protein kinase [Thermomonospora cellulosilytica]
MPSLALQSDDPGRIGRYRLLGRLGEGGQGVVYLGEAPDGRRVAVKVLKTASEAARARFAREMQAAQRVAPFCTAAVLEASAEGPRPYVVSEFVEGPSLKQRVAERGPLTGGDLDRLMVNTASGLTAIHGAGIVHRDLKPANVLLGPDGPRVVDFGIARAVDAETHTQMVGTPAYFAPEWLRGEPPTPASDVFAWAGTMVYAATGRPPFGGGDNIPALMHRIATERPDLSGVPERVRGLLAECLDKDPARRPTARDLLMWLTDPAAAASATQPPPVAQTSPVGRPSETSPGHQQTMPAPPRKGRGLPLALAAGVALAALIAVLVVAFAWPDDGDPGADDRPTRPPATTQGRTTPPAGGGGGAPSTDGGGDGQGVPQAFAGTWKGNVSAPSLLGGENASRVTITLQAGRNEGQAVYPDWGCTNRLTLSGVTGSTVEFTEATTTPQGTTGFCIGGTVRLTLQGDRMSYDSPSPLGTGSTTGTLTRG